LASAEAVTLNGFVQLVVHARDATLAIGIVGMQARSATKHQKTG